MAKSRAKRSRKKRFDNFRNALFWIFCCGRRTVREYKETAECKEEKIAEPERVIEEVSYNKRDITAGIPGTPEGPPSPKKTKKQAPPPPKKGAPPAPIGSTTGLETLKHDRLDAIEKTIAEIELNLGKNPTSQQHSSANKAAAESTKKTLDEYPEQFNPFADDQDDGDDDDCSTSEAGQMGRNPTSQQHWSTNKAAAESTKKTLDEYPEQLNPFADDQDDGDDDDCGTSESGKKEKGGNTIEEYPEDLNPFSAEEDGQKETDDNEHQVKINKE